MNEETGPDTKITREQIRLARISKALGHPIRIYILELLSTQSCCYSGDLAEELPVARSTLSQHLKELKRAGLIQGRIHPPKIMYCLNRETWTEVKELFKNFFKE
jgi:ArsR family transcriptional regulator